MGIQDDIFDVDAALEGNPEAAKAFERVKVYFFAVEANVDRQHDLLERIARGVGAAKQLMDDVMKGQKR